MQALAVVLCAVLPLAAQSRRALIVGIDQYRSQSPRTSTQKMPPRVVRPPARGHSRDSWTNLEGAVADATNYRQILIDRYGFTEENIIFLPDRTATAQRILDTFQSHLIDEAKPGDISVFVFAGHGSRMLNTGSPEPDKMDQTLVPADSESGAPDIRDKELARLYRKAADKKVLLTVIADSCHSGGISRGAGAAPRTRAAPPDPHVVNDPPDVDPKTGKALPDPVESGYVLVISSALDTQAAEEMDVHGQARGVFSYFFQQSLKDEPADEPIDRIFSRTVARIRAAGRMQVPNLEGKGRLQASLLGTAAPSIAGVSAAVQEVSRDRVTLRGGLSLGLQQGCELVRSGQKNGTRIRITGQPTLAAAVAQIVSGDAPQVGDLFVLDRWTVPRDVETHFFVPSTGLPSLAGLRATAIAIRSAAANLHWIADPTNEAPDVVVRFASGSWEIERRSNSKVTRTSLGTAPTSAAWSAALANPAPRSIFVDFPPPMELANSLRSGIESETNAVVLVDHPSEAQYHLVGRLTSSDSFEYAWVLPNADQTDEGQTPLPLRTDWFAVADPDAAAQLDQRALNLARLRLWLEVSVPGGGTNPFPYSLALKNERTGELRTGGTTVEGEVYSLVLHSTPEKLKEATEASTPQWVYVAAIDQKGEMTLRYPQHLANTSANHLPREAGATEIVLSTGLTVSEPYGTDTLILLTSEEEIDPAALRIDPVQTRGPRGSGPKGSVTQLLFRLQGGSRGSSDDAAPTNWGVQRLTFRSIEKSQHEGIHK